MWKHFAEDWHGWKLKQNVCFRFLGFFIKITSVFEREKKWKKVLKKWKTIGLTKIFFHVWRKNIFECQKYFSTSDKKQSNLVKPEEAIDLNETIEELMNQYQEVFKTNDLDQLNPIQSKGGHFGPDDHKWPRCLYRVGAMTTKIHDFVSLLIWMVP